MRIAIDGTALCYPLTGIGRYTRSLLDALASERPSWKFIVLSPYATSSPVQERNVCYDLRASRAREGRLVGWRAWWFDAVLPKVVREVDADVFWAASGLAPFLLSHVPVALTVYDFVPER